MTEPLSRRELLRSVGADAAKARARKAWARENAPHRPPGAVHEEEFLARCTSCGDCAIACPHGSIFVIQSHDVADGTPVMALDERPCHLCEERPCIAACEPSALDPLLAVRWGYVEIDEAQCITFRGPECGACGRLCPHDQQAITFYRNRPQIDPGACIGCGLCIEACPTAPAALRFISHQSETQGVD